MLNSGSCQGRVTACTTTNQTESGQSWSSQNEDVVPLVTADSVSTELVLRTLLQLKELKRIDNVNLTIADVSETLATYEVTVSVKAGDQPILSSNTF